MSLPMCLMGFVDGGKCVRSTFMYLGWLCGADDDRRARCGRRPASNCCTRSRCCRTTSWTAPRCGAAGLPRTCPSPNGTAIVRCRVLPERFGESAAVLLGDLCLVWAEQMMRESGLPAPALSRAWPGTTRCAPNWPSASSPTWSTTPPGSRRWDACSTCRAANRATTPSADRSKSVRRWPGAASTAMAVLGGYGDAVGEAFQMRDDLLGIFGSPAVTGKPSRQRPVRTQGHQRRGGRLSPRRLVAAQAAARVDERRATSTMPTSADGGHLIAATGARGVDRAADRFAARRRRWTLVDAAR